MVKELSASINTVKAGTAVSGDAFAEGQAICVGCTDAPVLGENKGGQKGEESYEMHDVD
jgi:hypothetical protein